MLKLKDNVRYVNEHTFMNFSQKKVHTIFSEAHGIFSRFDIYLDRKQVSRYTRKLK